MHNKPLTQTEKAALQRHCDALLFSAMELIASATNADDTTKLQHRTQTHAALLAGLIIQMESIRAGKGALSTPAVLRELSKIIRLTHSVHAEAGAPDFDPFSIIRENT